MRRQIALILAACCFVELAFPQATQTAGSTATEKLKKKSRDTSTQATEPRKSTQPVRSTQPKQPPNQNAAKKAKTNAKKPSPTSRLVRVVQLPYFCVNGLADPHPVISVKASCAPGRQYIQANNASAIAALASDTEFKLKPASDSSIVIFCNTGSCARDVPSILRAIRDLAQLTAPTLAAAYDLPVVCVPNGLAHAHGLLPRRAACDQSEHSMQAANARDIASTIKPTGFTLTPEGASRLLLVCDKILSSCSDSEFKSIESAIEALAGPPATYVEDVTVPKGTASYFAKKIPELNSQGITAYAIGDSTVRLNSGIAMSAADRQALLERIEHLGFGYGTAPAVQRMFYANAGPVVSALGSAGSSNAPPAGANTSPNVGAAAPDTSKSAPNTGNVTVNVGASPQKTAGSSPTGGAQTPASGDSQLSQTTSTNQGSPSDKPAPKAAGSQGGSPRSPGTASPSGNNIAGGMAAVGDTVVFTDTSDDQLTWQRARLLTLLDLPRPEVLLNMWSFQASSPNGKQLVDQSENIRKTVSGHNDALTSAIEYGWAYLSRQMSDTGFFNLDFYRYVAERFVADTPDCEARGSSPCTIEKADREKWGMCQSGTYCLGYTQAFRPAKPTLTNILLGIIASNDPLTTGLRTVGCMEGKYEVYQECFPDRPSIARELRGVGAPVSEAADIAALLKQQRMLLLDRKDRQNRLSCELIDDVALQAQIEVAKTHELQITVPLTCFTIQVAKSFSSPNSFSTFSLDQLDYLAEERIADVFPKIESRLSTNYSATRAGILRAAIADFLFNYKVAQQYPQEFGTYSLVHSAQELNAEFNPLVVAFNQDVAAFTGFLMLSAREKLPDQNHFWEFWRNHRSFVADGLITVRTIGGVDTLVDTVTQSFFDATQARGLTDILAALNPSGGGSNTQTPPAASASGGGSPIAPSLGAAVGSAIPAILAGSLTPFTAATALAALSPQPTQARIGRQLTIDFTAHTLPGASSAQLDVKLWAQEDSPPNLYQNQAGASSSQDTVSRIARHNVFTTVRVESVKLFDVSSFSAMIQRPRQKFPLLPPFVEIPFLGTLAGLPLPAAKEYHRSTAIVSALMVPTAADLGFGIQFTRDRGVIRTKSTWRTRQYTLQPLTQSVQVWPMPIRAYHSAMLACLASNGKFFIPGSTAPLCKPCRDLTFDDLPPEP